MKLSITIILLLFTTSTWCQRDSIKIAEYSNKMVPLTGTKINIKHLVDESGKEVNLNTFRGKIIYLNFWDPGCGTATQENKLEPLVMLALKSFNIEKQVILIKICDNRVTYDEWKSYIDLNELTGLQLYMKKDLFKWLEKRNLKDIGTPIYWIVDRNGIILGTDAPSPFQFPEAVYLLVKATEGIRCSEAIKPIFIENNWRHPVNNKIEGFYDILEPMMQEYFKVRKKVFGC